MELKFRPERLTIIRRLRGITTAEIEKAMARIGGYKKKLNIDRWEGGYCKPNSIDKVELLAKATGVPIGFYYFNNVQIEMKDLKVDILVVDTGERVVFDFLQIQ